MSFNEKLLAQVRLTTTDQTLLYAPAKQMIVKATFMIISMDGAVAANLSMYHNDDGKTAVVGNNLMPTVPFAPNVYHDWYGDIALNTIDGNDSRLYVIAGTANVFTLTLYGAEIK